MKGNNGQCPLLWFSEGFKQENTIPNSEVSPGRKAQGTHREHMGTRNPCGDFEEDVRREMRPEGNSKAEQNELVKQVGKVL